MDREQLYRFFEGLSTHEEKREIKQWLEKSESHKKELFKEREFFDALILSDRNKNENSFTRQRKRFPLQKVLFETGKVAVIITLLITIGLRLHNQKMEKILSATNTLVVPAGQRANIQLPDGTNVWLNARSELTYPAYFTGSSREVKLNGEAYFEVTHDKNQPFIVHTRQYDIEVLGTSFNVEAYPDSEDFSTALIEGVIELNNLDSPEKKILLSPGEKVINENGTLKISEIDNYEIYRWREGLICFTYIRFTDLMKQFEKCFGISIILENPSLHDKVFSGKFRISDGVDNALRVLQREGGYGFEWDHDDDTVIYIK